MRSDCTHHMHARGNALQASAGSAKSLTLRLLLLALPSLCAASSKQPEQPVPWVHGTQGIMNGGRRMHQAFASAGGVSVGSGGFDVSSLLNDPFQAVQQIAGEATQEVPAPPPPPPPPPPAFLVPILPTAPAPAPIAFASPPPPISSPPPPTSSPPPPATSSPTAPSTGGIPPAISGSQGASNTSPSHPPPTPSRKAPPPPSPSPPPFPATGGLQFSPAPPSQAFAPGPGPSPSPSSAATISAAMQANPNLKTINALIQATGLISQLNNSNTAATVFAPSDKAFLNLAASVGNDALGVLGKSRSLVTQLLDNHLVFGQALSHSQFQNGQTLQTQASGQSLKVAANAGQVLITPSAASSGVLVPSNAININGGKAFVYVIDGVLLSTNVKTALQATAPNAAPSG